MHPPPREKTCVLDITLAREYLSEGPVACDIRSFLQRWLYQFSEDQGDSSAASGQIGSRQTNGQQSAERIIKDSTRDTS